MRRLFLLFVLITFFRFAWADGCDDAVVEKKFRGSNEQIYQILRELNKIMPISPIHIRRKGKNPQAMPIIERTLGYRVDIATIYNYMLRRATYPVWLRHAGLDPDVIFEKVEDMTDEQILSAIAALYENGYSVTTSAMHFGRTTADVARIIKKATGRTLTKAQVYHAATRKDLKWKQWLQLAGVPLNE